MGRPCTEAALQSRTMEHFPPRRRRGQKSLCLRVLTQGGYSIAEQALVRWSCNAQQCVCVRSTSLSLTSSRTSLLLTLWTYPLLVLSFKASPYHLSSSSLKTFFFLFFSLWNWTIFCGADFSQFFHGSPSPVFAWTQNSKIPIKWMSASWASGGMMRFQKNAPGDYEVNRKLRAKNAKYCFEIWWC